MPQITTEKALSILIDRAKSKGISQANINYLESLAGTNPEPDVIEFYSSMIEKS